eukprot:TRINITY_DN13006_c0_g1_i1.p1 TRINITY_DN13006_c0_g1~~TRINITY_DN13006_c0_g1_i1.p1  ORF type:complete len:445 (-),score=39.02 TRINITY_DN13006_c0_g1_i1:34-1368(-)
MVAGRLDIDRGIHPLHQQLSASKCPSCTGSARLRCSRCHFVSYCSPACQKQNWNDHRTMCRDIATAFAPRWVSFPLALLFLRLVDTPVFAATQAERLASAVSTLANTAARFHAERVTEAQEGSAAAAAASSGTPAAVPVTVDLRIVYGPPPFVAVEDTTRTGDATKAPGAGSNTPGAIVQTEASDSRSFPWLVASVEWVTGPAPVVPTTSAAAGGPPAPSPPPRAALPALLAVPLCPPAGVPDGPTPDGRSSSEPSSGPKSITAAPQVSGPQPDLAAAAAALDALAVALGSLDAGRAMPLPPHMTAHMSPCSTDIRPSCAAAPEASAANATSETFRERPPAVAKVANIVLGRGLEGLRTLRRPPAVFSEGCVVREGLGAMKAGALRDLAADALGSKRADDLMAGLAAVGVDDDAFAASIVDTKLAARAGVLSKAELLKLQEALD